MTGMYSNGNSFGASAGNGGSSSSIGPEPRWPVSTWKFGLDYIQPYSVRI